jgi:gluconolactonase
MKMQLWLLPLPVLALAALAFPAAVGQEKAGKYPTLGRIERFDERLDKIVPKNAKIEKILDGQIWTEGPCWVKDGGYLLYSDIPRNSLYKWQNGKVSLFLKPSGYTGKEKRENEDHSDEPGSNGVELTPSGDALILCQHGDRRVVRMNLKQKGKFVTLASKYMGKRLNSPNDCVFDAQGNLYFTDPPYGLRKRWEDPERELDFCGVYKISKDGKLTLLTKEMSRPNGIALSADEKTLFVANSDPMHPVWMSFPIKKDGTLGEGKLMYNALKELMMYKLGLPDGMCIDAEGNLFATGPGGCFIFSPQGDLLGLLLTGQRTSNCTFGEDGRSLFLTTDDYVTRIRLNTRGKGF